MAAVAHVCQKLPMSVPKPVFMSGGEVLPKPGWHMPLHSHPFHELIIITQGTLALRIDGRTHTGEAGDVLFYQAGSHHEETARRALSTFFLAFTTDAVLPNNLPVRLHDSTGRIRQIASWLVRDHQARLVSPGQQETLFQVLLTEVGRLAVSPPSPWLLELRAYMQKNLARPFSLGELAVRAGMSRFAFIRKFKRAAGHTPMQELRLMRLQHARALLLTSGLPLKAIAPAAGLGDEYQLSKLFRRHFKLSPGEMRVRSHSPGAEQT